MASENGAENPLIGQEAPKRAPIQMVFSPDTNNSFEVNLNWVPHALEGPLEYVSPARLIALNGLKLSILGKAGSAGELYGVAVSLDEISEKIRNIDKKAAGFWLGMADAMRQIDPRNKRPTVQLSANYGRLIPIESTGQSSQGVDS